MVLRRRATRQVPRPRDANARPTNCRRDVRCAGGVRRRLAGAAQLGAELHHGLLRLGQRVSQQAGQATAVGRGYRSDATDQGGVAGQFQEQDLRDRTLRQHGPEAINKEFGQRRADAVAKYLVELGVPQQRIVTDSLGSSRPLVVTPRNTSEISNRRVEVVFGC